MKELSGKSNIPPLLVLVSVSVGLLVAVSFMDVVGEVISVSLVVSPAVSVSSSQYVSSSSSLELCAELESAASKAFNPFLVELDDAAVEGADVIEADSAVDDVVVKLVNEDNNLVFKLLENKLEVGILLDAESESAAATLALALTVAATEALELALELESEEPPEKRELRNERLKSFLAAS